VRRGLGAHQVGPQAIEHHDHHALGARHAPGQLAARADR
jgi:hypothetical protein